jgi:hypothetical protein
MTYSAPALSEKEGTSGAEGSWAAILAGNAAIARRAAAENRCLTD